MARPRFVATDEQRNLVDQLASLGTPQDAIAAIMGIDPNTLRKYFDPELKIAGHKATAKVANALFKNATQEMNLGAQIFWLKTRGRWKEAPQEIQFPDAEGKPQAIPTMADFYKSVAIARMPADGDAED